LLKQPTKKKTPQAQVIPGREKDMAKNRAGGWAFKADSFEKLDRWLILGSEGNHFYAGEQELSTENVDNVRACIQEDGLRAVKTIVDISTNGRAAKNDPALYALALAITQGVIPYAPKTPTQQAALDAIPRVARIGTHLFTLASFIDSMGGWGPAVRKAFGAWYLDRDPNSLAKQLVKYQQRNGWSHRDVLRLVHPKADLKIDHAALLRWSAKGAEEGKTYHPLIAAFEEAKGADEKTVIRLIREHGLTREMIPTEVQKSPAVWEALLEEMPMTAMIRTLGRMGSSGLLVPLSDASKRVVAVLGDREALRAQRVHPIQVLAAILTYGSGKGQKGSLSWPVVPQVKDALNDAFYAAFENVDPTGKNFYLGVDVSGSMTGGQVAGLAGLTPNMGAAAMAMLIARTEKNYFIGGFSTQFCDLGITASDTLETAMRKSQRSFGGTDCATPIRHALARKYPVDAFVVLTDGMTWAGDMHASQAIIEYRQKMGRDAKLIVMNFVPYSTKLTDPLDSGSLDCVGFDASVPAVINGFLGSKTASAEPEDSE